MYFLTDNDPEGYDCSDEHYFILSRQLPFLLCTLNSLTDLLRLVDCFEQLLLQQVLLPMI